MSQKKKFIAIETSNSEIYFEEQLADLADDGYKIISAGRNQIHTDDTGTTWWAILERREE